MKKEVITMAGQEKVVRPDTAKAWRIQNWSFMVFFEWITVALLIFALFLAGLSIYHGSRKEKTADSRATNHAN